MPAEDDMIESNPPTYTYRCDVCTVSVPGDSSEMPPPGFATVLVNPEHGAPRVAHLCVPGCLALGAENLADGRSADGRR